MQTIMSWWKKALAKLSPPPKVVTSPEAEAWITGNDPAVMDDLFRFGGFLLAEMNARTSGIDSKSTAILGWSIAALAFLTVGTPFWIQTNSWLEVIATTIAILCSLSAAVFATLALRARHWPVMSEQDWFRQSEFSQQQRLRAYHLISMLETHRECAIRNSEKGAYLVLAQRAMMIVAAILTVIATARVFALFIRGLWG
jgi:hypothetical protein